MMASDGETPCLNDANFAVICSFLKVFGKLYGLEVPSISKLEEFIENTQDVLEPLKDIHVRLLRRAFKSVPSDKWEKCLIKFCHQQGCHLEAWELERFSYKKSSTQVKLKVLKILLEYQFTCNNKFKNSVNAIPSKDLRLEPIGKDKTGCAYWLHVDDDANLCLFKEDLDEETWQLVARNREELAAVIDKLKKGEVVGESIQDTCNINEDSNSVDIPDNKVENLEKLQEANVNSDEEENSIKKLKLSENSKEIKDDNLTEDIVNEDSTNKSNNVDSEIIDVSYKLVESKATSCSELKCNTKVEDNIENKLEIKNESDSNNGVSNILSQETNSDTKRQEKPTNNMTVENLEETTQSIDGAETGNTSTENTENEPKVNFGETDIDSNYTPDANSISKADQVEDDDKHGNKTSQESSEIKNSNPSEEETKLDIRDERENASKIETETSEPGLEKKEAPESSTIENEEVSETIEEAVMVITGEGNGADCESGYYLGEEICEPVMYFWGEGCGYDNDTGNTEIVEKTPEPPKKAKHVDQINGEVNNETKTPITSIKLRSSHSSVVRRTLKKSGDASEPVKIDPKKHCVRKIDIPEKDGDLKTVKSIESDNVSGSMDSQTPTKQIKKINKKDRKATVLPRKITLRHKAELLNLISETENGNDQKMIEKRKSSVSSNENEETETHEENITISQNSESPKEELPPKKLKLESSADESEQNKILAGDNETDNNKSGEDEAQTPVHQRKKIKAKKGKFKSKIIKKAILPSDEKEKKDVTKNDSENMKTCKKSLKRTLLETCQSEQKSESQSESEEDEPVTKGKRLKVKPKKITLSTRKKVEESKLKQKTSSEESEEETLYSLAGKKSARKLIKKKLKSSTKTNVAKIQEEKLESDNDITPVRQSRRIAQLKIKEEAERRHMEEVALRELKKQHKKKTKGEEDEEEEWKQSGKSSDSDSGSVTRRPRANKGWRADSSSPPHSETEDEEPIEHEEPDLVFNKSDHEFSPESDLEGDEPSEPLKMARTLQEGADDGYCVSCGSDLQPEWILLCDRCDRGYHAACLKPVLFLVPAGDWYCPPCQHVMLIDALECELAKYDELLKVVEVEREKRRQEEGEKKIEAAEQSQENSKEEKEAENESESGSWSSSSSEGAVYRLRERRQLPVSYRAREYDRLISTAIKEEYEEPVSTAGNQGRGKDISTIIEAAEEEKLKAEKEALEQGIPVELRKNKKKNRRKPRKLNSLDVPSEDDDEIDEDFKETGLETSSEEISSEAEKIGSGDSRSSDSLPISRSCRINRKDRRKLVESSPEIKKKKKGVFTDSDSESSDTKEWKSKNKSKSKGRRRRTHGPSSGSGKRRRGLQQYDAEGNVVRARVTYGGLTDDNDWSPKHRTRQNKINYTEMPNTDSEDEMHKSSGKHMADSSDEFKITESDVSSDSEGERRKRQESDAEEKRRAICDLIKKTAVVPLEKLPEDVTKAKTEELEAHLSAKSAEAETRSRPARGRGSRGRKARGGRGGRGASKGEDSFSRLVGLKIKDLSQTPDEQTIALQLEKDKKRQEKEAKLAEKEARKQERLQKREEKKKLQEQKAKEREEKKNAKLAMQETKRIKKEKQDFSMAVPIQGYGIVGQDGTPRPAPRLQVRAELRAMVPDPARAHLPPHPHMHRLRGEGTLSVAGSPQPFKPVSEEPSVITRMPHMVNQQYRGGMMYGPAGYGYRFPPSAPYYRPPPSHPSQPHHISSAPPHLQRTGNAHLRSPGPPHHPSPGPPNHPSQGPTQHPSQRPTQHPSQGPHHPSQGPPYHPSQRPHHPSQGPNHPSQGPPRHPSLGPPRHPSQVPLHHPSQVPHHPSQGPHHASQGPSYHPSQGPHNPSQGPPHHPSQVPPHHPSPGPPQHLSQGSPHHPSPGPPHHPSQGPPHHPSPGPHRPSPGPHHPSPGPPHHPPQGPPHHPPQGPPHHPPQGPPHHPSQGPHHHPSQGPPRHPSPGPPHHPSPPIPHHIPQGLLHHLSQRLPHNPPPGPPQHTTQGPPHHQPHGPPHHPNQAPSHHLPHGPVHHPLTGSPHHTLPPHHSSPGPPRHVPPGLPLRPPFAPRFPPYGFEGGILVKTEVKSEPSPSPPAGSPPPLPPAAHRKMKVTESKDRKPRFPLGPYAPQYVPYAPSNGDPTDTNTEPISYVSQLPNKAVPAPYANENPNRAEAISYAGEASNKAEPVSYATEISNKAEPVSYANEAPNKSAISYVSKVANKGEPVSYASDGSNTAEHVSYASDGSNKAEPVSYANVGSNKAEPVSYASNVPDKAEPVSYAIDGSNKVEPVSYASDASNKAEPVSYANDDSNKVEPVSYASEMTSRVKPEPQESEPPEEEPQEGSSVFGGLVSYFSSQHEDDIDA